MKEQKIILFDLDGTLTESGEGITKSVQYALRGFGIEEPNLDKLRVFIGPPLLDAFSHYYGLTREESVRAVGLYRERFRTIGIYENALYPGIREMLTCLQEAGHTLAVASSKPEPFVRTVLDYFEITPFFSVIVGATMDETRTAKKDVIEEALRRLGRSGHPEHVIMVGDKAHDVIGASQAGVDCVAVQYGYGSREELETAGAPAIARTVEELQELLL